MNQEATEDVLNRLTSPPNNVVYAEIKFCPTLHILEGLTEHQAVEAVVRGCKLQIYFCLRKQFLKHRCRRVENPGEGVPDVFRQNP